MPFPTIPTGARVLSVVNTAGGATKTSPSLSSLTKNAGDLLLAICIEYDGNSTNAEFSAWGGSFTELPTGGDNAGTTTMAIGVAYKKSTGSETGTFTVTTADTSANDSCFFLLSIPGWYTATAPEAGSFATGTGAAADPASFDPPGWGAEDTLWIAVGGNGEDATTGSFTGITAAPTNYTNYAESGISADVVGGVEGAVGFRQLNAGSENVGTFTVDTSNARNAALVIAVRGGLTISPTLTADAVIYKAQSASITADAVILKNVVTSAPPTVVDTTLTSVTGTQIDIPLGTAILAGDRLVITLMCAAGAGPTWGSNPSGWTNTLKSNPDSGPGWWLLYKTAAGGDIGTTVSLTISSSVAMAATNTAIRRQDITDDSTTVVTSDSVTSWGNAGGVAALANKYAAAFDVGVKGNNAASTLSDSFIQWADITDATNAAIVVMQWTSVAGLTVTGAAIGSWTGSTGRASHTYRVYWTNPGFYADAVIAAGAAAQTPFRSKQMLQLIAQ